MRHSTNERKWLYVNYEKAYKILVQIYAEQEGIKLENIVIEKEHEHKWKE